MQIKEKLVIFVLTLVLPISGATLYYGWIASDVYISEARFLVRGQQNKTVTPLGALLETTGVMRAPEESYAIRDYILSRDALRIISKQIDLRREYSKGDLLARFPAPWQEDSTEELYQYYLGMVKARIDSDSSILTLTIRAFDPASAYSIGKALVSESEKFVNKLNDRARQDMLDFAAKELARAEEHSRKSALALADFRNKRGLFDIEKQANIPLQQVLKIHEELMAAKTMLNQLTHTARDNPQIPILESRIRLLQSEYNRVTEKLAGGASSLASSAVEYQKLALEKELADKQLVSAMISLEKARADLLQKLLYIELISGPSLPDAASEPKRLRNIVAVAAISVALWGIVSLLVAGVREHHE